MGLRRALRAGIITAGPGVPGGGDVTVGQRIGERLVASGVVPPELVEIAMRDARARGERLCTRLLALGVDEAALAAVLAGRLGVPGVVLSRTVIPLALLELVPRAVAEGDLILPVSDEGGRLHLAMAEPRRDRLVGEVRFVTGREVSTYVAVDGALREVIAAAYDAWDRGEALWRGAAAAPSRPVLGVALPPMSEHELAPAVPEPERELTVGIEVEIEEDAAGAEPARGVGARRILVVDDEPEIRHLLDRALTARGFLVTCAKDGEEGVARAEAEVPDLVLLDAMLPRLHGFEACRRLRSAPRTRHVPVVMMTALYRGWRFAADARETYGAADYVEKPFHLEDLGRRIAAVLDAGRVPVRAARASAPLLARARELLAAGHADEAIAAFRAAVEGDPGCADAHAGLARALRARGDAFGAMTAFERAAEQRPGDLGVLRALAALYAERGFRRKAAETVERALGAARDPSTRETLRRDLLVLLEC